MKLNTFNRFTLFFTALAIVAFCSNAQAGWGSLQGNNRNAPARPAMSHPQAPPQNHPQPPMHPAPPIAHAPEPPRESRPVVRAQPHEPPHIEAHVQPTPVAIDRARAAEADRRRMDIDRDNRQSFFWSDFHAGMRIDRLPAGYRSIGVRGHPFFYYEGVFYDNGPSGYVIVAPPVDAVITELPPGTETIVVGNMIYYYAAGAFYVQQSDGTFIVVAAPIGVTVTLLPTDATSTVINGQMYYQADGTYYIPVMQNGATAYLTVTPP